MLLEGTKHLEGSFKYISSESAFREEAYALLNRHFPDPAHLDPALLKSSSGGNRLDLDLRAMEATPLPPEVRCVVEEHTSLSFLHSLCDAFGVPKERFRSVSSRHDSSRITDAKVDFQFCFNEKNSLRRRSYLRAPHLDAADKLFVILVYFPMWGVRYEERDRGSLKLYATADPRAVFRNDRVVGLKEIDRIPYAHNHGLVFLNGTSAIHAPECLLNHPEEHRRFVNIIFMDNRGEII